MFSKSRINEPGPKKGEDESQSSVERGAESRQSESGGARGAPGPAKAKPAASALSSDLTITGDLKSSGDIVVEGVVDGDISAHVLTVGEGATIRGEVVADDVVVNGRVVGRVRGLKVRLTSSARVEGDIIHKTIAIESGAHFEGSVQRQEDPLGAGSGQDAAAAAHGTKQQPSAAATSSAPQPAKSGGQSQSGRQDEASGRGSGKSDEAATAASAGAAGQAKKG